MRATFAILLLLSGTALAEEHDILIKGARVLDGSGNPWFYGDVGLLDGRVEAVEPAGVLEGTDAAEVVDAGGMVVCPGFIDIQSHSIVSLMLDGRCLSKITQGVTTEVLGEGNSAGPYLGKLGRKSAVVGGKETEATARIPSVGQRSSRNSQPCTIATSHLVRCSAMSSLVRHRARAS